MARQSALGAGGGVITGDKLSPTFLFLISSFTLIICWLIVASNLLGNALLLISWGFVAIA